MTTEAIRTDAAPLPKGSYSQAVRAGNFLFVSGQLPLNQQGEAVTGNIAEETKQTLANVRAIVEAAGGTLASIAQCTIYISDGSLWAEVNQIYGEFFAAVPVLPARAVVPVKNLHYGAHIEIQAIAVLA